MLISEYARDLSGPARLDFGTLAWNAETVVSFQMGSVQEGPGLPWQSSVWDSVLPPQGSQV